MTNVVVVPNRLRCRQDELGREESFISTGALAWGMRETGLISPKSLFSTV